jgi:hypothetical protein
MIAKTYADFGLNQAWLSVPNVCGRVITPLPIFSCAYSNLLRRAVAEARLSAKHILKVRRVQIVGQQL